jgi:hypothetical protein
MDHLPKITNSKRNAPIHFLCTIDESFNPYVIGYSELKGWKLLRGEAISLEDGTIPTTSELAAFLQEWLFFGVLSDVLRIADLNVKFEHFVRPSTLKEKESYEDSKLVVSTVALRHYIDVWQGLEKNADVTRCRDSQSQVLPVLSVVENFFRNHFDYARPPMDLDIDLLLSILILAETLKNAAMYIWRLPPRESPLRAVGFFRRENLLETRMLTAGRCRSEVTMLHELLDNTGLYIAASIPWPNTHLQRSHDGCTKTECFAFQVHDRDYKTTHADDCADPETCPSVPVDTQEAASMLGNGKIPVIKVNVTDENIELEVSFDKPYIAISHVWSHGLGNVDRNALPRCQLLRLQHMATDLWRLKDARAEDIPYIWIDTLCIPRGEEFLKYRKLAIIKLAETFSQATKVLALDAELCQSPVDCFRTELATRVLCSGWMRRLWTLQESVMTEKFGSPNCQKLCIQIREGPVALNSLLEIGLYTVYYSEKAIQSVFSKFPQLSDRVDNFSTLSHALEYRTTSKRTDEAVCLASILGLDVRPVLDAGDTAEAKMCALYKQISEYPAEILFHRGERLVSDGYRWAPLSFLSSGSSQSAIFRSDFSNVCHFDNGLHGRFPGYIITDIKHPELNGDHFHFVDQDNPETLWRLVPESISSTFLQSREEFVKEQERRREFDDIVSNSEIVGLIINPEARPRRDIVLVRVEDKDCLGANDGAEIRGRYMCRASLFPVQVNGRTTEDLLRREGVRLSSRKMSNGKQWCVF